MKRIADYLSRLGRASRVTDLPPGTGEDLAPEDYVLKVPTEASPETLREELRKYQPWGHRIDFSNGVSTSEFERRVPFSENLLVKFHAAAGHIPFDALRQGSLLDIGSNSGHNSIHAAATYGMRVVGIDVSIRHQKVSTFLASLAGIDAEFLMADAETFSRPQAFDVVLHFGTLYHLQNPLLSLRTTFGNLKAGGYLALETQAYQDTLDPTLCAFMHMQNNDPTNFWALSEHVLQRYLGIIGFEDIKTVLKATPPGLPKHQYRVLIVARRPG